MALEKPGNFDLDEDLFDFEPVAPIRAEYEDEDADLDEIFATIQAEEEELGTANPTMVALGASNDFTALDEEEDDIYGSLDEVDPTPEPASPPAPEPVETSTPAAPDPEPVAAAPVAASEPAPTRTVTQVVTKSAPTNLSRSALWILLAAMSLNGLVAIVLVSSTQGLKREMNEISQDVEETIGDIRSEYWGQRAMLLDQTTPIAAPDPENHPAFALALDEIEAGAYNAARQRLYALLAVIDRSDPETRDKVEARASYLIGHAWHLEALRRMEAEELGGSE